MVNDVWDIVEGELQQGDVLPNVFVPSFNKEELWKFQTRGKAAITGQNQEPTTEQPKVSYSQWQLIVLTQSCDLARGSKVKHVTLCPIDKLEDFFKRYPEYQSKQKWGEIKKGSLLGYFILPSDGDQADVEGVYIVDFRQVITLPLDFANEYAASIGPRLRLQSTNNYLEALSRAFGDLYARIGIPDIPWGKDVPIAVASKSN